MPSPDVPVKAQYRGGSSEPLCPVRQEGGEPANHRQFVRISQRRLYHDDNPQKHSRKPDQAKDQPSQKKPAKRKKSKNGENQPRRSADRQRSNREQQGL